jgi:hypothetical protein
MAERKKRILIADDHPLVRPLRRHLHQHLLMTPHGLLASAPKRSALMIWHTQS